MNKTILVALAMALLATTTQAFGQEEPARHSGSHKHAHQERRVANKELHQKWKLDAATRSNLAEIKRLLHSTANTKDFDRLAKALQGQTDKLIKECRMDGPDHEALHDWLEDYLKHLKQLKGPGDNRLKAYQELQGDIKELDARFE